MKLNWKITTMIMGTAIGALVGAGAAYLMIQKAEVDQKAPRFTAQQGLQVGMGLLGILRQLTGTGSRS